MAGKKPSQPDAEHKNICRNRKASHEFEVFDTLECGMVLTGTEVKSLREGGGRLDEAYAKIEAGELWLIGCEIAEYARGTYANHKPKRTRKLLIHKQELRKFAGKASQQGFTLVPLRMYFKEGRAKLELAVARGKKMYDKRQDKKKAEAQRAIQQASRRRH
jgi:SsrA-binding protein